MVETAGFTAFEVLRVKHFFGLLPKNRQKSDCFDTQGEGGLLKAKYFSIYQSSMLRWHWHAKLDAKLCNS